MLRIAAESGRGHGTTPGARAVPASGSAQSPRLAAAPARFVRGGMRAVASVALLLFFSAASDPTQPRASPGAHGSLAPHAVRLTGEDRSAIARTDLAADNGGQTLAHRAHVRVLDRSPSVTSSSDGSASWRGRNEPIEVVEVPTPRYVPSGFLCARSSRRRCWPCSPYSRSRRSRAFRLTATVVEWEVGLSDFPLHPAPATARVRNKAVLAAPRHVREHGDRPEVSHCAGWIGLAGCAACLQG